MNKKQKLLAIHGLIIVSVSILLISSKSLAQETGTTTQPNIYSPGTRINGIGDSALSMICGFINQVFGSIGSTLYTIAGGLANFSILLNFDILNNPMINTGWQITRDLANLGFVLFIIIIAIATILRMQQYGAKSALGKLIAVALLVNFSLVFAGIFIDFSNMLTNFFIKNITSGDPGGLATALSESFKIQNLLQVKEGGEINLFKQEGRYSQESPAISLLSLLHLSAFFFIRSSGDVFGQGHRIGYSSGINTLACLSTILPATKKLWSQWVSNFTEWAFFGPIASFFLYLAVSMATNYGETIEQLTTVAKGIGTRNEMTFANLMIAQPLIQIGRMFLVIGFLLGGLAAANSMKTMGASAVVNGVNAFGKWARGAMGRGAAGAASLPLRTARGQKLVEGMQKTPGFRRLGTMLSNVGVEQGTRMTKQAEERINKRFASDRSAALAISTLNWEERVAVVKRLMKNKTMGLMEEKDLNNLIGNKATEANFARLGAKNVYDDFEKSAGRNRAMVEAKTPEAKEREAKEFFGKKYSLKDFENLRKSALLKDEDGVYRMAAIIKTNPGALSKLIPKFAGEDFDKFEKQLRSTLPREIEIEVSPAEPEEKDNEGGIIKPAKPAKFETIKIIDKDPKTGDYKISLDDVAEKYLKRENPKLYKALSKTLTNRAIGIGEFEPPAAT